jgi:hypothetical protein
VRQLFLSRPFLDLVPDQSVLAGSAGTGAAHQRAAREENGRYLIVYTPYGTPVSVWLGTISGDEAEAHWFNPRTGEAEEIGSYEATGKRTFDPPEGSGRGRDWVLVVDAASADFGSPGQFE